MKTFSENANAIFNQATADYHINDSVNTSIKTHLKREQLITFCMRKTGLMLFSGISKISRDPNIDANEALKIKRTIDISNQLRTDLVERIDSYFLYIYKDVTPLPTATINTESPAWALDRLSILAVKIYHMADEAKRADADKEHVEKCESKLEVT